MIATRPPIERAVLVGVESGAGPRLWSLNDSMTELALLARTAGVEVVGQVTQRLEAPNPATYIGKGKVEELAQLRRETAYDLVIFDEELSPSQQRNLEKALGCQVMDRTALILDIFAQRARTHEGRLQVELAQYEYYLPRLTRLWTHLSRQTRGGVGLRGPGETQLESDRRRIRKRIHDLRKGLEEVRKQRALYRHRRREEMLPVVALVGYTNAGKSTLLRTLTGADVLVEDKLFATLDPTTRRVKLPNGQESLWTDTVGFIQKLPAQLVAAFRATLEELNEADVLVHVVDITHRNAAEQVAVVEQTLKELGLSEKPVIMALNKIDRLLGLEEQESSTDGASSTGYKEALERMPLSPPYRCAIAISALRGIGLEDLLNKVAEVLGQGRVDIILHIPFAQGDLVASLQRQGGIIWQQYTKNGVELRARVPRWSVPALRPYLQSVVGV